MKLLTENALLTCDHRTGVVDHAVTQDLVAITGGHVLVEDNPERKPISGCNNRGVNIYPCLHTVNAEQGYSDLLRIEGKRVCLDTVVGLTDGTIPGTVHYRVRDPGQTLVSEGE